jgi:glucose/mannose-6-phosphate isomerase
MGGSALSGEFIKSWLGDRLEIPLIVTRGYDLPNFVGKDTLVIASSYSGNTEETISCLNQAIERKAKILCLSTGGMIEEIAVDSKLAYIKLPSGIQPRLATLYGVKALCDAIEAIGWLDGLVAELSATAKWVEPHLSSWIASTPTETNPAKQLANAFFGHPLVIYGGPTLSLISMKWKISSNENAKNLAFYNYLPEFNHNEFLGWGHPAKTSLRVVQLQSSLDSSQVKKRFEVSNRLLSGSMPDPIVIHAKGESKLDQMVWAIILGDFAMSYYLQQPGRTIEIIKNNESFFACNYKGVPCHVYNVKISDI